MFVALSDWLAATAISEWIASTAWVIPAVQTVHILAIAVVMSSILMFDLRLLGMTGRNMTVEASARRFLPWIWGAMVVLAITGVLLILGEPARELLNNTFRLKMILLAVVLVLTAFIQRALARPAGAVRGASAAKVLAIASLGLWVAIVTCGRWIAYTTEV